jgi:hypothetical protein
MVQCIRAVSNRSPIRDEVSYGNFQSFTKKKEKKNFFSMGVNFDIHWRHKDDTFCLMFTIKWKEKLLDRLYLFFLGLLFHPEDGSFARITGL